MLEGVILLETFPLVEWHYGELADVPSFTVLKMQICVTRPQCVKNNFNFALQLTLESAYMFRCENTIIREHTV